MFQRIYSICAAALLAGLTLQPNIQAANGAAPSEAPSRAPAAKQYPFRGKLAAVDKEKKIIGLAGRQKTRSLQITERTKILRSGKPAQLDQAIIGENVAGLASRVEGKEEVITLHLGAKAAATARAKKRKAAE